MPLDVARGGERRESRGGDRGDQAHAGAGGTKASDALLGDGTAADADDETVGEVESCESDHRGSPWMRTNTMPSVTATGCTRTLNGSLPCVSRHRPVRRSKTCLYIGDATVGTPPRSRRFRATGSPRH